MLSSGGDPSRFINLDSLDFKKYVKRPALAKVCAPFHIYLYFSSDFVFSDSIVQVFPGLQLLCDYIFYFEHNPKKALELCSEGTVSSDFKDWWWKARLGKAYYQLGMYRDAEKQFKSALRQQEMVLTYAKSHSSPSTLPTDHFFLQKTKMSSWDACFLLCTAYRPKLASRVNAERRSYHHVTLFHTCELPLFFFSSSTCVQVLGACQGLLALGSTKHSAGHLHERGRTFCLCKLYLFS